MNKEGVTRGAIFATLIVAAGCALSLAWFLSLPKPSGDRVRDLEAVVARVVDSDHTVRNCVLAVRRGDRSFAWSGAAGIAYASDRRPMTKNTPIFVASVTKLYTATVVMLLVEKGAVDLDDPMAKYLPADLIRGVHVFNGKDYSGQIEVRELLSHRSGLADYYDEKASDGKSLFELLREQPNKSWTVDDAIERVRDKMQPNFAPGTSTRYSDTNFQLLGKLIEAVTGQPFHVALETRILGPLDLKHTWLVGHPRGEAAQLAEPAEVFDGETDITRTRLSPSYWADGGIVSTVEDMIAFLQALNEGRIISRASLERMHDWRRLRFPLEYGLGTMGFHLPGIAAAVTGLTPLWGHSGSTGSFLYYSADENLYIAGTVDQTEAKAKPFAMMRSVLKILRSD